MVAITADITNSDGDDEYRTARLVALRELSASLDSPTRAA